MEVKGASFALWYWQDMSFPLGKTAGGDLAGGRSSYLAWWIGNCCISNHVEESPNRKEVRQVLYLPEEEGQGMVEYALILVLVAIVVIAILMLLGPQIGNIFSRITSGLLRAG
jgi:pilus assembly protein Flp/PilA